MIARILLAVMALMLTGCGAVTEPFGLRDPFGVPKPFEGKERNAALAARIVDTPAFLVGGIDGMEGEEEDNLRKLVADALREREIVAATKNPPPGAWLLMGSIANGDHVAITPSRLPSKSRPKKAATKSKTPTAAVAVPEIKWTVQDGTGKPRGQFMTPFEGDVAGRTAAFIANAMDETGSQASATGQKAAAPPLPAELVEARPPHATVTSVTGAPGDGNRSLALSMTLMLSNTGLKMTNADDALAWHVVGAVSVVNAGAQDNVTLTWVVKDAKGSELGKLEQKNPVPAKSLAKNWGETAALAAAAAAPGLAEIIGKAHNSGLDPANAVKSEKSSPPVATKP